MKNLILSSFLMLSFCWANAQQNPPKTPKQSKNKIDTTYYKKNQESVSKKSNSVKDTIHPKKKAKTNKSAVKTNPQRKDTLK
ncbi:hypothetical protein [Flavobacterium sp. 3-210]